MSIVNSPDSIEREPDASKREMRKALTGRQKYGLEKYWSKIITNESWLEAAALYAENMEILSGSLSSSSQNEGPGVVDLTFTPGRSITERQERAGRFIRRADNALRNRLKPTLHAYAFSVWQGAVVHGLSPQQCADMPAPLSRDGRLLFAPHGRDKRRRMAIELVKACCSALADFYAENGRCRWA